LGEAWATDVGGAVESLEEARVIADSLLTNARPFDRHLRHVDVRDQHGRVVHQRNRGARPKARSP